MKKLRSRKVYKISTAYISSNNYDFNLDLDKAKIMGFLTPIAYNQVFHAIDNINGITTDYSQIDMWYEKIKQEKMKTKPNKHYIAELRKQIDIALLVPEIINIKVDNKKAYRQICKNGFTCNGERYVRLLCGTGMGRRSTVSFCHEKIYNKLDQVLRNGLVIDEINIAKWNAYYGLYMSGGYEVSTPRRFVVIPDCELTITGNKVDFIVDDKKITPSGKVVDCRRTEQRDYVFNANVFDGSGLISYDMASRWAKDLDLDYTPSNFIVRSAFIKGMVSVFDFHDFAVRNKKDKIVDCYGKEHNVNDIDIILTVSQFKMWKRYYSLEHYQNYCAAYSHIWIVSRFSPKQDKEYSLINYQYIQTLNLDDKAISDLTQQTESWIRNICSGDELYTKLFVCGSCNNNDMEQALLCSDIDYVKALCVDFDLFSDDYIRRKVYQLIQKKINEAKIGRLWVMGNYQTMIPDPYALAQHAFGLDVTGLLPKDCHYSQFWIERNVQKIDAMRSPMVDASEHKISDIVHNEEMDYWYKYLQSGIVMNIWGLDTIIHSDSDADGDIVFTTNNQTMINNIYQDRLPITYDKESAPAQKMNMNNIIKTDLNTFDCKIGQITNYSTKFFSMLCNYDKNDKEYEELTERIKLLRRYIGDSIDAGKGVKTKPFPAEWKSWKKVSDEWSEEQKKEQWLLNNLVEKRKPYFFVYIYDSVMEDYKREKKRLDKECKIIFDMNFKDLKIKENKTQEEKNFIRKYYNELPVTKTPCIMNKIAWKIENLEVNFKYPKNSPKENFEIGKKLMDGNYKIMKSKLEKIRHIYKDWKSDIINEHRNPMFQIKNTVISFEQYEDIDFACQTVDYEENQSYLREFYERELEQLIPNEKELADYLVHLAYIQNNTAMKSFCWIFGSKGIICNLLEKNKCITVPVKSETGVAYLGSNYELQVIR